jgi:hypothetical protein
MPCGCAGPKTYTRDAIRKAVVLDSHNCTWSKGVIGLPSVVKAGNRLALFYDGVQGGGRGHMGRDVGLAFLDLPLQLPLPSTTSAREHGSRELRAKTPGNAAAILQ